MPRDPSKNSIPELLILQYWVISEGRKVPRGSLCQVLKCFKSGRLLPFGFAQDKLTAFLAMTLSKSQACLLYTSPSPRD